MTADAVALSMPVSHAPAIIGLWIVNSSPTKLNALGVQYATGLTVRVENCIFGDATNKLLTNEFCAGYIRNSSFIYHLDIPVKHIASSGRLSLESCVIARNDKEGALYDSGSYTMFIVDSLFYRNGLSAIRSKAQGDIHRCLFAYNGKDGIEFTALNSYGARIYNCIFAFNNGYGIRSSASGSAGFHESLIGYNCFYGNASGATLLWPTREGDVFIDPQFVDPANDDFRIGENLKALGFPSHRVNEFGFGGVNPVPVINPNMTTYVDIGAAQRQEPAGTAFRPIVGAMF